MLNFGNKEFRNLQEQVAKNKEDIEKYKSGVKIDYVVFNFTDLAELTTQENVGKYVYLEALEDEALYVISRRSNGGLIAERMGRFPATGPEGPEGPEGPRGPQGEMGKSIIGFGTILPASAREGDFFIQAKQEGSGFDYWLMKYSGTHNWVKQCSLRGPQGPKGEDGDEVTANPLGDAVDNLSKIMIDGVIYSVVDLTEAEKTLLARFADFVAIDASGFVEFGNNVEVDGTLKVNSSALFESPMTTESIYPISTELACDIGASDQRYGNLYLNGTVYLSDTNPNTWIAGANGDISLRSHNGLVKTNSHFRPEDSGILSLGYSNKKWNQIYCQDLVPNKTTFSIDVPYGRGSVTTLLRNNCYYDSVTHRVHFDWCALCNITSEISYYYGWYISVPSVVALLQEYCQPDPNNKVLALMPNIIMTFSNEKTMLYGESAAVRIGADGNFGVQSTIEPSATKYIQIKGDIFIE